MTSSIGDPAEVYRAYPSRWWVLATLSLINISINALWISVAPVATKVADYYEVSLSKVDLLLGIGFIAGTLIGLLSTWLVAKLGLRKIMLLASIFAFTGGAIRCIATFPGLNDNISKEAQYWCAFVGQLLIGVGNPLAFCLPPKVGHDWFPQKESMLASGLITMSFVVGVALGSGLTPVLFPDAEDVPYLNITWFIPTCITLLFAIFAVKSDRPPTPPSKSSETAEKLEKMPFGKRMKRMLKNPNFLVLMFSIGGVVGLFNACISQIQQLLCSRGYPDWFSGLCGLLTLIFGIVGGIGSSLIVQKTGMLEETAKVALGFGAIIGCVILQLFRVPDLQPLIATLLSLVGLCAFGVLPLGFELSLETTYPLEPAAGISLIFVTTQLLSAILIGLSGPMEKPLATDMVDIEVCSETSDGSESNVVAKNHTRYLLLLSLVITLQALVFIVCFRGKYKRRLANEPGEKEEKKKDPETKSH